MIYANSTNRPNRNFNIETNSESELDEYFNVLPHYTDESYSEGTSFDRYMHNYHMQETEENEGENEEEIELNFLE